TYARQPRILRSFPTRRSSDLNGFVLQSKTVIIATGARWRNLNVPGEEQFKNKGVAFCPHCDGPMFKNKDIAVVGGGNSGVEAAIDRKSTRLNSSHVKISYAVF